MHYGFKIFYLYLAFNDIDIGLTWFYYKNTHDVLHLCQKWMATGLSGENIHLVLRWYLLSLTLINNDDLYLHPQWMENGQSGENGHLVLRWYYFLSSLISSLYFIEITLYVPTFQLHCFEAMSSCVWFISILHSKTNTTRALR